MSLLTPSGGLVYHLRALRYRSSSWAPFRSSLASWLGSSELGASNELLLVGPSAGHCLPLAWLERFERLTLLEPDPVARRLLALRLSGRLEIEHRDLLLEPLLSGKRGLDAVLERRPGAAVLFCNVLGQLHFALSDEQQERFRCEFVRRIVPALSGRAWASFHDHWSLDWLADAGVVPRHATFEQQPSDALLAEAWFGSDGPPVTVLDHGTGQLFSSTLPRDYFSWQITPRALHVIEAVRG